jgi:hypothetical protein
MLGLFRIILSSALLYTFYRARLSSGADVRYDDLTGAAYLIVAVVLGIACACVWAPYLGAKVADPLTGGLVQSHCIERSRRVLKLIRWAEHRGLRRLALLLCFIEGVRYPWLPSAFVLGLKNARPGTWLEKVFAREVFRFNNTQNCLVATQVLQKHGIQPSLHEHPEINIALNAMDREPRPEPSTLPIPPADPPPPPRRNTRIQIGVPNATASSAEPGTSHP